MSRDDEATIRVKHVALEELRNSGNKLLKANDALVMLEFQQMLKRQAEQEIVIGQLRELVSTLTVGHVATVNQLALLQKSVDVLEGHIQEVRAKQEKIAALCDSLTSSIEGLTEP